MGTGAAHEEQGERRVGAWSWRKGRTLMGCTGGRWQGPEPGQQAAAVALGPLYGLQSGFQLTGWVASEAPLPL